MDPGSEIIRRARCLVLSFEGQCLLGYNFMTRLSVVLDGVDLAILSCTEQWDGPGPVYQKLEPMYGRHTIADRLLRLINVGFVVVEGTSSGNSDIEFEARFEWGLSAGHYHFSIRDPTYMDPAQVSDWLTARVAATPRVPLFSTNEGYAEVVQLEPPCDDDGLFSAMQRRRSYRGFGAQCLSLEHLRDCLFAGFGITGFIGTETPGEGRLPIGMTPSAGARNPYEGYVYARNVERLRPGVYHYSAVENSLGLITDEELPSIGTILADQPWFDEAAVLILLVANFDRTIWKYPHPTGYRVVLLEAGHIAQNILLAATNHGVAAAPTCAVSDSKAEEMLGLNSVMTSVIYTVALGNKSDERTQADTIEETPNPLLVRSRS